MIEPADANSPSLFLAPNLLALESRPFLVEPAAFLDAKN